MKPFWPLGLHRLDGELLTSVMGGRWRPEKRVSHVPLKASWGEGIQGLHVECLQTLLTFLPIIIIHNEPLQQAKYWLYLYSNFESSV